MGVKKKERNFGFIKLVTLLFSTLIGSTLLSGLIITPALLLHFFWYKPHPTDHRKFVKDNVEAWLFWAAANLSISWGLALIVDIVPAVIRILISIVWGHVSEVIKSRLELYASVKGPIKPVLYAASGWVSWVILFSGIYKLYDADHESDSRASYTPRVYEVIEFLFFFTLVICAQKMLSHFIAFSFHRTAYKERLEEVGDALRVIEKLRVYRPKRRHAAKSSFGRSTPVFSALLTPSHERDRFLNLNPNPNGGSRPSTPGGSRAPSRAGTPEPGHASDNDDDRETTLVGKKGKQRTSWFGHPRSQSEPQPQPRRQSSEESGGERSDQRLHNLETQQHRYPPSPLAHSPVHAGGSPARARKGHAHAHGDGERESEDDADAAAMVQHAATHAAKALKTAILHDARNIQGRDDAELGGLVWNVTSSHEAKRLARAIYTAFRVPGRNYLIPRDFYPAFAAAAEAERAFKVFDKDGNGDISRAEIKTTLVKVYKERRFLSRSMRDVGQALRTLDNMLLFLALLVLFFISLSVFGVKIENSLTSLYTIGIGASFIFKNSASNAFDAIMFLFVTHPYDTGDRCFIDDENLVVKKMGLFATIFTRSDGTETYYFNSQLFNKFITNVRRSDKTAENLTMKIAWKTPIEKLDQLEKCLNTWLQTEENRWFQPSTSITLQHIHFQQYLECTIGIPYNSNWQDWGLHNARKTAFHAAVNYYCRQLGIVAYEPALPLAYANADTLEIAVGPEATSAEQDEDGELAEGDPPASPADPADRKAAVLGFTPPREDGIPSGMRRRRAKSRKAMFRTFGGADGF
ncbi:Mechanosensitive ion channel-domain-containing protein [Dichomitus squalens]|uniref:Mechanosensitive ion channel-domain-containing protein n=1 Tax=Dichomitus squalens TaxID=114155 RepID=A0A4Q9QAT7_9APHY|nr:Mechanosensitive ion channel-domain-containing protein [Dichomitus squalens]TBU64191.1 Mechanosensitive ion channel-domain-containing protein [Dichomitus squalens]